MSPVLPQRANSNSAFEFRSPAAITRLRDNCKASVSIPKHSGIYRTEPAGGERAGANESNAPQNLIDKTLFDLAVRIDSAISQKWPMRPMLVDASPIDFRCYNLFFIDRAFGDDFAIRPAHKTLAPKFNAISTGWRFVTDAVRHRDVTPVCDRMTALNRFPRGMLCLSEFLFLARMPP